MTHQSYLIPYESNTVYLFFIRNKLVPYKIINNKTCKIFNKNIFSIQREILRAEKTFKLILIKKNKLEYQLFSQVNENVTVVLMRDTYSFKTIYLLNEKKIPSLPKKKEKKKFSIFHLVLFLVGILIFEKFFSVKNF